MAASLWDGHFVFLEGDHKRVLQLSYQRSFSGIDRKPASISLIFPSVSVSPLAALNVAHIDCSAWSVIDRTRSIGIRVLLNVSARIRFRCAAVSACRIRACYSDFAPP